MMNNNWINARSNGARLKCDGDETTFRKGDCRKEKPRPERDERNQRKAPRNDREELCVPAQTARCAVGKNRAALRSCVNDERIHLCFYKSVSTSLNGSELVGCAGPCGGRLSRWRSLRGPRSRPPPNPPRLPPPPPPLLRSRSGLLSPACST